MSNSRIILGGKVVGDIKGEFFIPSYQRGYRWGKEEVLRLLDDIYANGEKEYWLQPIVIKKITEERYELIDGQQRLTTLYLIYKFMEKRSGGFLPAPNFSLVYDTREESTEFLKSLDLSQKEKTIDTWFMVSALEVIKDWFEKKEKVSVMTDLNKYFEKFVKVIWYEVGSQENEILLFERLNIGKIPLTSAELVKAMFLKGDSANEGIIARQNEIAIQWDLVEKELRNEELWGFLSNEKDGYYKTRIDLILDIKANKQKSEREKYYTFFYFDKERRSGKDLKELWAEIYHTFLVLKSWYDEKELYHKIGYLLATGKYTLQEIYDDSKNKTKTEFKSCLDEKIKTSIDIKKEYGELSYESDYDYDVISRMLLLFNVESVRNIDGQRFPFNKYKSAKDGVWSLEHIHAQQSKGLSNNEAAMRRWLEEHGPFVKKLSTDEKLKETIEELLCQDKIKGDDFEKIRVEVEKVLSAKGSTEYLHSIANLALLKTNDNAALNNATFAVKRKHVIKMDSEGKYIPHCTKMVFLKYYNESEDSQIHFWGEKDREAYVAKINEVLYPYFKDGKKIIIDKEANQ